MASKKSSKSSKSSATRVVVVGGGVAGVTAVTELRKALAKDDVSITLIDAKPGWYHMMDKPAAITYGDGEWIERVFVPWEQYLENGAKEIEFVHGLVEKVQTKKRRLVVRSAEEGSDTIRLKYDVLLLTTGCAIPGGTLPLDLSLTIEDAKQILRDEHEAMAGDSDEGHIVVVGGGATGVEVASAAAERWPEKTITLVHSGPGVLLASSTKGSSDDVPAPSEKFSKKLEAKLAQFKNLELRLDDRVVGVVGDEDNKRPTSGKLLLESGEELEDADFVFWATGSKVRSDLWAPEDDDATVDKALHAAVHETTNQLIVDQFLRVRGLEDSVFAAGDAAYTPGDPNTGAAANKQGLNAGKNIAKVVKSLAKNGAVPADSSLTKAFPVLGKGFLLILGRKEGAAELPFGVFGRNLPVMFKGKMLVDRYNKDLLKIKA